MFQAHSEQERYSFCPHVAYIQNRKDRILKRMIDQVFLTDTVLGSAKRQRFPSDVTPKDLIS